MKRVLKLALAATVLAIAAGPALAIDFYHDKANWQDAFMAAFGKAPAAVTATPYADTSSYQAAVRASLKTPSAPGLFTWWSGYRMKDLVDAGLLADVSDIWKKHIDSGKYNASLADPYTFDGKVYGVPDNIAWWVVFYNKKVFAQYNLTPPKTWEDLEKINATLKQNNVTPFGATIEGRWPAFIWFEEFLIRQDPDLYAKLMSGEAKYTDQGVTDMFAKWKEWIDKGYFTDPSVSFGTAGGNAMASQFAQGKLAMILVGTWYFSTFTQAGMSGDDVGAFIMPNMKADMKPALIAESAPDPCVRQFGTESRRAQRRGLLDEHRGAADVYRPDGLSAHQRGREGQIAADFGAGHHHQRERLQPDQPLLGSHPAGYRGGCRRRDRQLHAASGDRRAGADQPAGARR